MTGHIRARSPGSFELRYRVDGKLKTTTVKAATKKDAEKELRRLLTAVDTGTHVDPTRMTVAQWLDEWLGIVAPKTQPQTLDWYRSVVNQHLKPVFGGLPMRKLDDVMIARAYAKWATSGRRDGKDGGLAASTLKNVHAIFHIALTRAVKLKKLARNPADGLREELPKGDEHELEVLSGDQARTLLNALAGDRFYVPVLISWATGMRRGEVSALTWKAVDLEKGEIRVAASMQDDGAIKVPKSGKARTVGLPSFAVEALRRHRIEQAQRLLMQGIRQSAATSVADNGSGEPLTPPAISRGFAARIVKVPGVPAISFHGLRHSYATNALAIGVPLLTVSRQLGHASIAITADIYGHVNDEMRSSAAARFDEAFRGPK